MKPFVLLSLLVSFVPFTASAFLESKDIRIKGLADFRAISSGEERGWQDNGFGKFRYGGTKSQRRQEQLEIPQVAAVIEADINRFTRAKIHLQHTPRQRHFIDIVESFAQFKSTPSRAWQFRSKLGIFFPKISLESVGRAWSSPYSITPSAINSWVGEELRTIGAEFGVLKKSEDNRFGVAIGLFKVNDPTTSLLSWRGFAFHDRITGYRDDVPYPFLKAFKPAYAFAKSAQSVEPFRELDGRLGYYVSLNWSHHNQSEVRALFYDNRANKNDFSRGAYAWDTQFLSLGARHKLNSRLTIISQALYGDTKMGTFANRAGIDNTYWSAFVLLSQRIFKKQRITTRVDWFGVKDNDITPGDDNREHGHALLFAYQYSPFQSHKLSLEYLRTDSTRPTREYLANPAKVIDHQLIFNYRVLLF